MGDFQYYCIPKELSLEVLKILGDDKLSKEVNNQKEKNFFIVFYKHTEEDYWTSEPTSISIRYYLTDANNEAVEKYPHNLASIVGSYEKNMSAEFSDSRFWHYEKIVNKINGLCRRHSNKIIEFGDIDGF